MRFYVGLALVLGTTLARADLRGNPTFAVSAVLVEPTGDFAKEANNGFGAGLHLGYRIFARKQPIEAEAGVVLGLAVLPTDDNKTANGIVAPYLRAGFAAGLFHPYALVGLGFGFDDRDTPPPTPQEPQEEDNGAVGRFGAFRAGAGFDVKLYGEYFLGAFVLAETIPGAGRDMSQVTGGLMFLVGGLPPTR